MNIEKTVNESAIDKFVPEPLSGSYDEQISKIWKEQLPSLPSDIIPLMALADVVNGLVSRFHHIALKPYGFSHIEYSILSTILMNGSGVKPSIITDIVGKGSSGTSQALRKLEKNGHITRVKNPNDKRSVTVNLTDSGKEAANKLCESEARLSSEAFNGATQKELLQLRQSLGVIIDKLTNI